MRLTGPATVPRACVLLAAAALGGCAIARPAPAAEPAPRAAPGPDFARKPGSIPSTAPDVGVLATTPAPDPVTATSRSRVSVDVGACAFDGAFDLDPSPSLSARIRRPVSSGVAVELPATVVFASREARSTVPPSTTASASKPRDPGLVIFVEPGVHVRRELRVGGRRFEGALGLGAGFAAFEGLGEDELAFSARGSASWSTRVGERLSAFLAFDGHLVASDRGSGGPTWRPVVFLGAGLSWDL